LERVVEFVLSESGRRLKPEELLLIREVLRPYGTELITRCLPLLETTADRLRAGCLLAGFAVDGDFWPDHVSGLASDLVRVLPSELGPYRDALSPIRAHLIAPLITISQDTTGDEQMRLFATDTLADFLSDDTSALFDLLVDAQAKQFPILFAKLAANQQRAIELGTARIAKGVADGTHAAASEALTVRQANAAVMLLRMDAADRVWPLLRHRAENFDPRTRSYIIHWLSALGGDPAILLARFAQEQDATIRCALLLCLGEFDVHRISDSKRQALIATLLEVYRTDPDSGLHAAAEWLLRKWDQGDQLAIIDAALKQSGQELPLAADKSRQWYINGQGQTYVILEAGSFQMGSIRKSDPDHQVDEIQHRRRIDRRFAIGAKEVTKADWREFSKDKNVLAADDSQLVAPILTDDSPMTAMTWYEAAWYCNWLSAQEGIPEDQWCYVPNTEGKYAAGMKANPKFLELTGYRLPTESEWEYACRANTVTARHYGFSVPLLPKYGWYATNSQHHAWPVASLKPNDFGLFDMHGNALEWCYDLGLEYPVGGGGVLEDTPATDAVADADKRILRGGSFYRFASILRSANRSFVQPDNRANDVGFRVTRTIP
jgi:formylglycine-generating enzyme required for sulfatase activity